MKLSRVAWFAVVCTSAACAQGPGPSGHTSPALGAAARTAAAWSAVQKETKLACQTDNDCQSLGVGHRGCGGPQAFVAWSTRESNAKALARAAAGYEKAMRQEAEATGAMSTCQVLPDPGAWCDRASAVSASSMGQCALRTLNSNLR